MESDRESERLFSLRLSRMMEDIGVNSWMISRRRRRTQLRRETLSNLDYWLTEANYEFYMFGSQSEATTTPGMESDTDVLHCDKSKHVALNLATWKYGKPNLRVLKNELTPPQHCYLQRLRGDCPLPAVHAKGPDDVLDREGRVLLTNTMDQFRGIVQHYSDSGEIIQHGPSMSHTEKIDNVQVYHCRQLPGECQFMFHRPRPGHWPMPNTLARAGDVGVFLVPQGYSESPTKQSMCRLTTFKVPSKLTSYRHTKWQWRFSTSMMERFLMFDFSPIQVKTYTLVKMIRKSLLKPLFGDRFSTFHIKTVMMYTIENYPPEIWREDNIVQCVSLLWTTLKRCLKQKYCPHYTISGVNLFVGKLHIWELPQLCTLISHLNNSELYCLFFIRMDNIGLRLLQCSGHGYENVGTRTQSGVAAALLLSEISGHENIKDNLNTDNPVDDIESRLFILQSMTDSPNLEQEVVTRYIQFVSNTLASILPSRCINLRQQITQDILHWYQLSLDSDLMSSRLKFASMLYCRGQYDEAAEVVSYCEGLIGPEVFQFCVHIGREKLLPSPEFLKKAITLSNRDVGKKYTMLCITFTKEERHCIPKHLQFDMVRRMGAEHIREKHMWKNNVVTDYVPFLYYLQHLTYRELHKPRRAQIALHNLHEYTFGTVGGHIDSLFSTAMNLRTGWTWLGCAIANH